jgi:hypothetical protein
VEYFPPRNLKCTGIGPSCSGAGFVNEPGCGTKGEQYVCQGDLLAPCSAKASGGEVTQLCK